MKNIFFALLWKMKHEKHFDNFVSCGNVTALRNKMKLKYDVRSVKHLKLD